MRVIAFYLPQFHPIPENNQWWGNGFTEWTNVGKAKKLFLGHYQPHVPADLGYYDLRVPEARQAQADLAKEYGVEGFCYWHYWFGNGKRLLERPFNEVLTSGEPSFPFCLAWANQSWKGFSFGVKKREVLIEQKYYGKDDYVAHFKEVFPAFCDQRYMKIDGKPIFMIYQPLEHPELEIFINLWQKLALENGLAGIFFIGNTGNVADIPVLEKMCLDAICINRLFNYVDFKRSFIQRAVSKVYRTALNRPIVIEYKKAMKYFVGEEDKSANIFPCIIPNWDHSPRSGKEGLVYHNSTPSLFKEHAKQVLDSIANKPDDRKIVFLKSWNEWAEGNYIEPDLKFGKKYLEVLKNVLSV